MAEKPAGHRNLARDARDAWRAFDRALAARGIVAGDRLRVAREVAGAQGDEGACAETDQNGAI